VAPPSSDVDTDESPAFSPGPSTESAPVCERCGGAIGSDDYCTTCGVRSLGPIEVDDRGRAAFATHRGTRHPRNEDAAALGATRDGHAVIVVADGVSASPNPHLAAAAAVRAAADQLAGRAFSGPDDLRDAVAVAHDAACAVPADTDPAWAPDDTHPACTIVVAVATPQAIHLANVGDARGYRVRATGAGWATEQLSVDDSVASQAVNQGIAPATALALPGGHAITAWLGADAPTLSPHVTEVAATPGDLLLVCSDGLWNYAPTALEFDALLGAGAVATLRRGELAPDCEALVRWAIDQGGADNICVALAPITEEAPT
jgi:serine/threonine protein phosphatase PrpC